MNAFRFVHPGPVTQLSGGTVYDLKVIEALRGAGWRVDLHELAGRFPIAGATASRDAGAVLDALDDRTTVVIDGLALPAFGGALAAHGSRLTLVGMVHHPVSDETGLAPAEQERLSVLERALFARLHGIVVPSPAMMRRLSAFGVTPDRVRVAEPGVAPAARAAGSGGGAVRLLCVASLTPRKGHAALLEALAGCLDLDWRLTCAGPGDLDPATTRAVADTIGRLDLSDRVELVGPKRDAALDALYAAADVFVLASRYEGYGIVFAEAMARGLPIVASGAGAVADTVPESAGIVVPVGDRAALAAGLRRMIADPAYRKAMADGAWAAGKRLPRWSDTAQRFGGAIAEFAAARA